MNWIKNTFTEPVRAYIYRVLMGIGAIASLYGYLTANEIATWLGLAAIVLNIMPAANTTTKKQ